MRPGDFKRKAVTAAAAAGIVVTGFVGGVAVSSADDQDEILPYQPPTINTEPLEDMPVSDASGDLVACDDGNPLLVDENTVPPEFVPDYEVDASGQTATTEALVARCGPDGGQGAPVWVPMSVGVENPVNAPDPYVWDQYYHGHPR